MNKINAFGGGKQSYAEVMAMLEEKFFFLNKEYNFVIKKKSCNYGIYLTEESDKISILFCYGSPEFEISMSLMFKNNGTEEQISYEWGELLMSGLFPWEWSWVPEIHDKISSALETYYIFITKYIDFIINNSDFIEKKLKENRENIK